MASYYYTRKLFTSKKKTILFVLISAIRLTTAERQNLAQSSTRKLCYRKDDRAMRFIHGCPEISGLPDYAHGYYSQHFSLAFVPIDPVNVPTKFEVRSFTRS